MGKVVYNACYGGFGLSRAATERLAAMGVEDAVKRLAEPDNGSVFWYSARDIPRHDPRLVRVVEEMGAAANGQCADLRIADIGNGAHAYKIEEHDGQERVKDVYCDGVTFGSPADEREVFARLWGVKPARVHWRIEDAEPARPRAEVEAQARSYEQGLADGAAEEREACVRIARGFGAEAVAAKIEERGESEERR